MNYIEEEYIILRAENFPDLMKLDYFRRVISSQSQSSI